MTTARSNAQAGQLAAGKYLTFSLGSEEYGIAVLNVREIIGIMPVTSVPGTPDYMLGVINLRGKIIPIIDLRARFGMELQAASRQSCIIVVRAKDVDFGILVDSVAEVRNLEQSQTDDMLDLGVGITNEYFEGISKADGKVRMLLNIGRIVSRDDLVAR
jgi:purine-binding chemotaxis protein CheW